MTSPVGLEPTASGLEVRRAIHCATETRTFCFLWRYWNTSTKISLENYNFFRSFSGGFFVVFLFCCCCVSVWQCVLFCFCFCFLLFFILVEIWREVELWTLNTNYHALRCYYWAAFIVFLKHMHWCGIELFARNWKLFSRPCTLYCQDSLADAVLRSAQSRKTMVGRG